MRTKIICILLMFLLCIPGTALAMELESEGSDVVSTEESIESDQYDIIVDFPDYPLPVYEVNPDDYNGSKISTFAINGDVYSGSYNSTVLSLWNGLLSNNVGKDYIAYRGSQYDYYIFFGEDFAYSNGVFTGTGTYYHFYTYGNAYSYSVGSDSFFIDPSSNYLYTNVTEDFPALELERGYLYEHIQTVVLIALLAFSVLRWIFIRK